MLNKSDLLAIKSLIEIAKGEIKEDIAKLKSKIEVFEDNIAGRLDKIDQEQVVTNGYGDQLEDHERRITKLENIQTAPKV